MPRVQARKTVTVELPINGLSPVPAEDNPLSGSPLFELGEGAGDIAKIGVIRDEPIEEGQLGYLPPDATEDDIRRRWGGGVYRLQGKTERGQHIKGAFRTVKLSGEPKIADAVAAAKYNRLRRQELGQSDGPEQGGRRELSLVELMTLQEEKAEAARKAAREDFDRKEAERDAAHRRELERMRLDMEARDRERKAEDERRERERRADDERRERERRADDERRAKDQEEGRSRDREFFAAMLKMHKEESKNTGVSGIEGAIKLFMTAREMFGGEGGEDAVTALMKNVPAILDRATGIAAQITGQPAAEGAAAPAPAGGIAQGADEEDPEALTISGAHARELQAAIDNLQAQGIDPNRALLWQFRQLAHAKRRQGPQPGQPAKPAADVSPPDEKQSAPAQASPAPARPPRSRARARRR